MSSKTSIIAATTISLAFAIGFGWYSFQSTQKAKASFGALNQDIARLDESVQRAKEQIVAHRRDAAALEAKLKSPPPANEAPKAAAAKAPATKAPAPTKDQNTLMQSDAQLRGLYLKQWLAGRAVTYGLMYQRLGLTQAQIEKFEKLAMAYQDDLITMAAAAAAQGFDPNLRAQRDAGLAAMTKKADEQFYATVASEIGSEAGAALSQQAREFDRTAGIGGIIYNTAASVPRGTAPITATQSAKLTQLVANASAGYQNGGRASLTDVNWDAAYAQAATILSEPQLQAFKARVGRQQISNKVKQFYSKP